jgi:hypothetical protein
LIRDNTAEPKTHQTKPNGAKAEHIKHIANVTQKVKHGRQLKGLKLNSGRRTSTKYRANSQAVNMAQAETAK